MKKTNELEELRYIIRKAYIEGFIVTDLEKQLLNWRDKWGVGLLDKICKYPKYQVGDVDCISVATLRYEATKLKQQVEKDKFKKQTMNKITDSGLEIRLIATTYAVAGDMGVYYPTIDLVDVDKWVIRRHGYRYTKSGKWIPEPLPSSRSAYYTKKTHFKLEEATKVYIEAFKNFNGLI